MSSEVPGEKPPELDIPTHEIPELNQAIDVFDQARREFLAACTAFAAEPSEQGRKNVGLCGSLVTKTFRNSVAALREAEPDERSCIHLIANLMTAENQERINHFRHLTDCDDFSNFGETDDIDEDTFEDMLLAFAMDIGITKLVETVSGVFLQEFSADVEHFAHHAIEDYEPAPESKKRMLARLIAHHALDIGKVALGTAIGTWALQRRKA